MKALFIGGTGNISTPCSRLALEKGIELTLLNRGETNRHPIPKGAKVIHADIRDKKATAKALGNQTFDVVVNWIGFKPDHMQIDLDLFKGSVGQYIFISSASAYQSPPSSPFITESTPLQNPFWDYSRDKIACEEFLMKAYRDEGFPATIVRPSYTYDTVVPAAVGNWDYTIPDRMLRGKKIIVHGDGSALWVMTHSEDFAKGFVGLMGNVQSIGHAFHITSDEVLTWNQIYKIIGQAVGVEPQLVHIPTDFIGRFDEFSKASLLGDKGASVIFDNTKIKTFVPGFQATISFAEGMRRTMAWFDADKKRKTVDAGSNKLMDSIVAAYEKL